MVLYEVEKKITKRKLMKSNKVQYKRELSTTFEKEVVAFLNHNKGGII